MYENGTWRYRQSFFQSVLTSHELKLKQKTANIAGLQLADLLAHPMRVDVLIDQSRDGCEDGAFGHQVRQVIAAKYYRNPVDKLVAGYGKVFLGSP